MRETGNLLRCAPSRVSPEGDLRYRVQFRNLPQSQGTLVFFRLFLRGPVMIRLLPSLLVLQLIAGVVSAATFSVGPGGTYATLQEAIDAAIDAGGDNEIQIQQGVYLQTASLEEDLSGILTISGGWLELFQQQSMDPNLTVFNGDGISRILEINLSGGDLRFEYLSFVGGFSEEEGGGLKLEAGNDAELSFVSCQFISNRAGFLNGSSSLSSASAIHALIEDQAGLSLKSCVFRRNETGALVAGSGAVEILMRNSGATRLHISNCEFTDNFVRTRQANAFGGALSISANGTSEVHIEDSLFVNNSSESSIGATRAGGLLLNIWEQAHFQILGNSFSGHRIRSGGETRGGALEINASDQVVGVFNRNRIEDSQVTGSGPATGYGSSFITRGSSLIEACQNVWLNNRGPAGGTNGQLELSGGGKILLRDSLIAGGSGGIVGSTAVQMTNLTVAHNQGTGIQPGAPNLDNSIVYGNETDLSHPDTTSGEGNLIGIDPYFRDAENGDFRPMAGSPAINGGSNLPPGGLGEFDLDGEDRLFGPVVDIGAFELNLVERTQFLTQVGNGQSGNIILSTEVDVANTAGSGSEAFTIDFFDSNGDSFSPFAANPSVLLASTTSAVSVLLSPGETWRLETSGEGEIQAGYARIRSGDHIGITGIFTRKHAPTGTILYQAGVPASEPTRAATLFVDSIGNLETGLAMVNAGAAAAPAHNPTGGPGQIALRLYDSQFQLLGQTTVELTRGQHLPTFVSQLFPDTAEASEMQGILTMVSLDPIALPTLRQSEPALEYPDGIPTLAAFPVLEGSPEENAAPLGSGFQVIEFFYAQIGNGRAGPTQLQTSVNLVNLASGQAGVRLDLFDSSGAPLELTIEGLGSDSSFEFQLDSGESRVLKTDGLGELKAGYARVTTFEGVSGSAVFSQTHLPSGLLETESGVPASVQGEEFSLFLDTTGELDTGIALVNPGQAPAGGDGMLELRLFDLQGQEIASRDLDLPPGHHTAMFVTELFAGVDGIDEMQGLLTISSPFPIVAVTLLQNDDPETPFPEDVATLTAFPVLPATP